MDHFTISSSEDEDHLLVLSSDDDGAMDKEMEKDSSEGDSGGPLMIWTERSRRSILPLVGGCGLCESNSAGHASADQMAATITFALRSCSAQCQHVFHGPCLSRTLAAACSLHTESLPDYDGKAFAIQFKGPQACGMEHQRSNFWIYGRNAELNCKPTDFMPVPVDYENIPIRGDANVIWPKPPVYAEMSKGVASASDLANFVHDSTLAIKKGGFRAIVLSARSSGSDEVQDADLAFVATVVEDPDQYFSAVGFLRQMILMFEHESCSTINASCNFFFDINEAMEFNGSLHWC